MSFTKIGLVLVILMYSILLFNSLEEDKLTQANQLKTKYSTVINNTLNDTAYTMLSTIKYENEVMQLNIEECLKTFRKTLTVNLNIEHSDVYYTDFMNHVPLILFIDGDGLYSYALSSTGGTLEHVLHEKRYFTYYDDIEDLVIRFTFSDYYEIYDTTYNLAYRGSFSELKALGIANSVFSLTEDKVIELRNKIVMEHINNELLRINDHNNYAEAIGVGYKFFIPDANTTFTNTINSPGIATFIQGISLGKDNLNVADFAVATVVDSEIIEGYDNAGRLVYYEISNPNKIGTYVESFNTKKEAAQAGYYPSSY